MSDKTKQELQNEIRELKKQIALQEINQNITTRRAEEETFTKNITSTAPVIILILDNQGRISFVNPYLENISGYSEKEMIGQDWFTMFLPGKDQKNIRKLFKTALGGTPTKGNVNTIRTKDGKMLDIEWYDKSIRDSNENIIGLLTIGVNVTEKIATEKELVIERNNLRSILQEMSDGVYIVDQEYNIQYVNPALIKDFGSPEGKKCYKYFHNANKPCVFCKNREVFNGKTVPWEWTSPKGKTYDLIDTPIHDTNGNINKLEIFRDITEIRKAGKIIRESEKQFRLLAENSIDCIWTMNTMLRFTYLSPSLEKILGFKPEQWVGTKMSSHFSKKEFLKAGALAAKGIANYKTFTSATFETKMKNSDNKEVDVEISCKVLLNEQGKLLALQ